MFIEFEIDGTILTCLNLLVMLSITFGRADERKDGRTDLNYRKQIQTAVQDKL